MEDPQGNESTLSDKLPEDVQERKEETRDEMLARHRYSLTSDT